MARYGGDRAHARTLSPESYCFILDIDNGDRLEFQLLPDVISENKSAFYNEIPIIGRSLPLIGYSSSSSRTIGLNLSFVALKPAGKYSPYWVRNQVRWLESKVYPEYIDGFVYPPPRLLIVVGKALGMQCVMTSVNTNWMGPWAVSDTDAYPFRAEVACQFQEYGMNSDGVDGTGHPYDHEEAKRGRNQRFEEGSGSTYVDIPLLVPQGPQGS